MNTVNELTQAIEAAGIQVDEYMPLTAYLDCGVLSEHDKLWALVDGVLTKIQLGVWHIIWNHRDGMETVLVKDGIGYKYVKVDAQTPIAIRWHLDKHVLHQLRIYEARKSSE